jgi:hypothetical protein
MAWRDEVTRNGDECKAVAQSRHPTMIVSPQVTFSEISDQLAGLGWQQESASESPILPGEPELAVFVHRQDATVIHYTFNPVVMLRVLQFRGSNAEAQRMHAVRRIPVLAVNDLRPLLSSGEIKRQLLGLFAVEELREIELIEHVTRLCAHAEDKISRTATRVRASLLTGTAARLVDQLETEQARHPERSVWFSNLHQPELRKQTLRWLMRDAQSSNQSIDQVLNSALKDSDPEVRVTAVLAAARLRATNLIPAVRDAEIPTSSSAGADERDRFFYQRLRQTTVGYLSMEDRAKNQQAAEKRMEFEKAVSGAIEVRDDPTLLLYSLTTPVQLGDKPAQRPEAVEERDGNYCLRRSGIRLRWVAPVPHWLGEDSARALFPNPIRRVSPGSGFFIAELPITSKLALWIFDAKYPAAAAVQRETEPFVCGYGEAEHLCEVLGHLESVHLQLATADQWEMAARGPDGRRYPWGNSLTEAGPLQPSPWLVKRMVGQQPEWTGGREPQGAHVICGGPRALACARRQLVPGDAREIQCAVRPVLIWTPK